MERVERKNVRCIEKKYDTLPIGTKGYVNLGGTIYAAKVTGREIHPTATDFWVWVYDVWTLPNGEEYLTPMGGKPLVRYGDEWVAVSNTIEGAKFNENGEFAAKSVDTMEYLAGKYGLGEDNFQNSQIWLYKMVDGFPQRYDATYDIMFAADKLIITIPDIENGIGFATEEECRDSHDFAVVDFDEEPAREIGKDEEIEFKVTARKSDLAFLKEIGFKINY